MMLLVETLFILAYHSGNHSMVYVVTFTNIYELCNKQLNTLQEVYKYCCHAPEWQAVIAQWPVLLTCFNFNPNVDK